MKAETLQIAGFCSNVCAAGLGEYKERPNFARTTYCVAYSSLEGQLHIQCSRSPPAIIKLLFIYFDVYPTIPRLQVHAPNMSLTKLNSSYSTSRHTGPYLGDDLLLPGTSALPGERATRDWGDEAPTGVSVC